MEQQGGALTSDLVRPCRNLNDVKPFYPSKGLFLKPFACLYISVQIPSLKTYGHSISTKLLTDKIKNWAAPDSFCELRLVKSTVEFVRFEGELDNRSKLQGVINRLDGKIVTLPNFTEQLKVRASVMKPNFPSRHEWDTFFRDAKTMNEMKPGERPDTIHISNLPSQWFSTKNKPTKPSESILQRVFEQFGDIRAVDIPAIDPYREQMNVKVSGLSTFSFNKDLLFDAFVQFKDYIGFVKAMDSLRGMKLLKKDSDKAYVTHIKVDFDKTKHLSESSIRKRKIEREKLISKEIEKENKKRMQEDEEEMNKTMESEKKVAEEMAKAKRRKEREEKRKAKVLRKLQKQEGSIVNKKIAEEERLLLIAQRKLESIRLLSELLERVKGGRDNPLDPKSAEQLEKSNDKNVNNQIDKKPDNSKSGNKSSKKSEESKEKKTTNKDDLKLKYSKSKSDSRDKSKRLDSYDYSLSETSDDNCRDYTEPLKVRKSAWHDDRWDRRAGRQGRSWSSRRNTNYSRNRSNRYGSSNRPKSPSQPSNDPLYNMTQQMYYKYFQSISKASSRSRSKNTGDERSEGRQRERRNGSSKESPRRTEGTKRSRSKSLETKSDSRDKGKTKRTRWENTRFEKTSQKSPKAKNGTSEGRSWSRSTSKDRDFSWEQDFV